MNSAAAKPPQEVIVFPSLEDIEAICYVAACEIFSEPEYLMPPLKWLDKSHMEAALGAVANSPFTSVPAVAARLAYYTTKNHPFMDGNKRMTIIILLSFLELNHWNPTKDLTKDELVNFIDDVSGSQRDDKEKTITLVEDWVSQRFSPRARRPWYRPFAR